MFRNPENSPMHTAESLEFLSWLSRSDVQYKENVDIASISQIKAGGRFLLMVKPQNEIMFAEVIRQLNK